MSQTNIPTSQTNIAYLPNACIENTTQSSRIDIEGRTHELPLKLAVTGSVTFYTLFTISVLNI